ESLIGTVAALLGTVVHGRAPIVEGELPINGYRFEAILPPVSTAPISAIRKSASQICGLEDDGQAGHLTSEQQEERVARGRERRRCSRPGARGTPAGCPRCTPTALLLPCCGSTVWSRSPACHRSQASWRRRWIWWRSSFARPKGAACASLRA